MNESKKELIVTKVFDASCQQVWDSWVTPNQIAKWFAPGIVMEVRELDVRPGGHFRFADPNDNASGEYTGTYITVQPLQELSFSVLDFSQNEGPAGVAAGFKILFESIGTQTRMTLTSIPPENSFDESTFNAWTGCFDRLADCIK